MEFTYETYKRILKKLIYEFGYQPASFEDYSPTGKLFLRHDVDIFAEGVLPLAEIEEKVGARSIWFYQPNNDFYNLLSREVIKTIFELRRRGHWIGLHVDASLSKSLEELKEFVRDLYEFYAKFIPLSRIISFHKPPEYVRGDFEIPGFVNVYGKKFFNDILYFSDSSRRSFEEKLFETSKGKKGKSIQLLTHPYWWGEKNMDLVGTWNRFIEKKNEILKKAIFDFKPYKNIREEEL